MSTNYVVEQMKSPSSLLKHCAIYIRVSDEKQADKVSPEEQERDCKELAKQKGYTIVEIYRDIKPYKGTNGRIRQCASYHWDRPQWLRMIADAKAGNFGIIIAWREDRLYRGVNKALLDFSNLVTEYKINVELVKDYYDIKTAPVKAWAAGMELDARHDRTTMGIKAKLTQGKHWNTGYIFGYIFNKEIDRYEINEKEAYWIRWMFEWYSQGISLSEIADRLNGHNAPRSPIHKKEQKYGWYANMVHKVLSNEFYYTGIKKMVWDGETFEGPIDPIISSDIANAYLQRHLNYKSYPNGATKKPVLTQGLVYCSACGVRMNVGWKNNPKTKKGNIKAYAYYRCPKMKEHIASLGCANSIGAAKVDSEVWEKLWNFISSAEKMKKTVEKRISQLEETSKISETEIAETENKLKNLHEERQEVINLRRKRLITDEDLAQQLEIVTAQEISLKRFLAEIRTSIDYESGQLIEKIYKAAKQFNDAYSTINEEPLNEEDALEKFHAKKELIQAFVKKILIFEDKTIKIETELDPDSILSNINTDYLVGINLPPSRLRDIDTYQFYTNTVFDKKILVKAVL